MKRSFTIRDLLWLMLVAFFGCTPTVKTPDQMTLYSIKTETTEADVGQGRFHDYPILGKLEITDAAQRQEIMAAVSGGIGKGWPAKCFLPRHAIRAVVDGQTIDYSICFHCSEIEIHGADSKETSTNSNAMPILDKYLKAASIPQVPEVKD
jgi:hypothetical protein